MKLSNQVPMELINQFRRSITDQIGKMSPENRQISEDLLRDPVVARIFFITWTDPEAYQLRLRIYDQIPLIEDRDHLVKLFLKEKRPAGKMAVRILTHDLDRCYSIDQRKLHGAKESVWELRKTYSKEVLEKLNQGIILKDCFPQWRQEKKEDRRAFHYDFYLYSKPKNKQEFENLFDLTAIWSIQDAYINKEETEFFARKKNQKDILITIYDPSGKNLNYKGKPFSTFTMDKYKDLIKTIANRYHFEPWEDIRAKTEEAFFKSILNYTKRKGHSPGYFELALRHSLSKEYDEKIRKGDIFDIFKREDTETVEGVPKVEIMTRTESDSALIDQAIEYLLNRNAFKDKRNEIIIKNLGKSAQKIGNIVGISGTAVQKRIDSHIKPMLREYLELRGEMREDQKQTRYNPMKRQKDSTKKSRGSKG